MVKLQENKNRWFITIPKEIVKFKRWVKGQELVVALDSNDDIVIKDVHGGQKQYIEGSQK